MDPFVQYQGDESKGRNLLSLVLAGLLVGSVLIFASKASSGIPHRAEEKILDVTFVEKIEIRPKPVTIRVKANPGAAQAPVTVPKHIKKVFVKTLPKIRKIRVPIQIRKVRLKEGNPADDRVFLLARNDDIMDDSAEYDLDGLLADKAQAVRDGIRAPSPYSSNRIPDYPDMARATGRGDLVILKIVIDPRGYVTVQKVIRGSEPFVSSAMATVKHWRYSPALRNGKPVSVYRIIKIPFRLRA